MSLVFRKRSWVNSRRIIAGKWRTPSTFFVWSCTYIQRRWIVTCSILANLLFWKLVQACKWKNLYSNWKGFYCYKASQGLKCDHGLTRWCLLNFSSENNGSPGEVLTGWFSNFVCAKDKPHEMLGIINQGSKKLTVPEGYKNQWNQWKPSCITTT